MRILILILAATAIAVGTINTPPAANTDGQNQVAGVAANKALVRPERPASLVYENTPASPLTRKGDANQGQVYPRQGGRGAVGVEPKVQAPSVQKFQRPAPLVSMNVSAFCKNACCCGKYADGITASGKPVTANGGKFCAADRSIPFGTMIDIPGYGCVPVLDRGGAIRGHKLDVYFDSHSAALQFGRRTLNVTIY